MSERLKAGKGHMAHLGPPRETTIPGNRLDRTTTNKLNWTWRFWAMISSAFIARKL